MSSITIMAVAFAVKRLTFIACSRNSPSCFIRLVFFPVRFVATRHILQQKVPYLKGRIGTGPLGTQHTDTTFSTVQYTDPESHNAQRYRHTDRRTDGQIDEMMMPITYHTVYDHQIKIDDCFFL